MAYVNANPNNAYVNSCFNSAGFLAIDITKDMNTITTPVPAPTKLIVAATATINLAALTNMFYFKVYLTIEKQLKQF